MYRKLLMLPSLLLVMGMSISATLAATPCADATHPAQCGWFDSSTLPPFVQDAILVKGGTIGAGNILVLSSGDPNDGDSELITSMMQPGCGTNPDGWQTYDCVQLNGYVPTEDSVVLALSSEWFEWYQTIFTDWMTISGAGVATVDVSINSWINNKVDIMPYGPMETGVVILTSLAATKMVNFRVADSGDSIYDTALVVVPATWFGAVSNSNSDQTLLCGNGKLDPGEECDDGNTITDDGCSSLCLGTQTSTGGLSNSTTCGNLVYAWPDGTTSPYTCGNDSCMGYRCVLGVTISPACFTAAQCTAACAGDCVDVQVAQLDCTTMCSVQPPATEPPPDIPPVCAQLFYLWPDGTTMPYSCGDTCTGVRCLTGTTIGSDCYDVGECDPLTCPDGTCVDMLTVDCDMLCLMATPAVTCTAAEEKQLRTAPNQQGACFGNMEICKNLVWKIADGSWEPDDEKCNSIDDDCNGIVDDMFVTCGDPGLCQNTVNKCDPANPLVPVPCVTLPPPSPVEICNDGLDNDCDGSNDDGCKCGDNECMPGESYEICPNDCPPPANGTPCEDGNLCTMGDTYQNGLCEAGAPIVCDAANACLVQGSCNPATGCSATKVNCDDGDDCTLDNCDPFVGCTHDMDPLCQDDDADNDGYVSAALGGPDCDDTNADVHPGALEVCNDIDDDCDTLVDEGENVCVCTVDGDLNGDATITVVDVQCSILVVLWSLGGQAGPLPSCLTVGTASDVNLNCDAAITVTDVILQIGMALGAPMDPAIDTNGDGCVDACEAPPL